MAKLKKQILGKVSGKFGDIVFRNTRKTNYIAARPVSFNVPMDEGALTRRGKFAVAGKLSSVILSIPELKYFWQQQTPANKNIHNYLISLNYPLVGPNGLNENVSITPPMGFIVQTDTITITEEKISLVINPIGIRSGINTDVEKSVRLFTIISLQNPKSDKTKENALIPLSSEIIPLSLTEQLEFEILLTNQMSNLINKYNERIFLNALVTFDEKGIPINYSATFFYV